MFLNLIRQILNSYSTYAFNLINLLSNINGLQLVVKYVLDEDKVNAAKSRKEISIGSRNISQTKENQSQN